MALRSALRFPLLVVAAVAILVVFVTRCACQFPLCPGGSGVAVTERLGEYRVCTGQLAAVVRKRDCSLTELYWRDGDVFSPNVVSGFGTSFRFRGGQSAVTHGTDAASCVLRELDFYASITSIHALATGGSTLFVNRKLEFTRGPGVFEHAAIYIDKAYGQFNPSPVDIDEAFWTLNAAAGATIQPKASAKDMHISWPNGSLGGLGLSSGSRFHSEFAPISEGVWQRPLVNKSVLGDSDVTARIVAGNVWLIGSVLYRPGADAGLDAANWLTEPQFYPDFGIPDHYDDDSNEDEGRYTFDNWNTFEWNSFVPINGWYKEMHLTRAAMYLHDRAVLDGGWPRRMQYSPKYPHGDRFTANSRSWRFPLYLWAHLTMEKTTEGWSHTESDADMLLEQWQDFLPFYEKNQGGFEDVLEPEGVEYLSYSSAVKERDDPDAPSGVLNAHAEAYQFAWLMREASQLAGDAGSQNRWHAVLDKYHPGGQELFRQLYPAGRCNENDFPDTCSDAVTPFYGIVQYARGSRKLEPWYNSISLGGTAAGYLDRQSFEADFVGCVERASRMNYDPLGYEDSPQEAGAYAGEGFVARLIRTQPVALSHAGNTVMMSKDIEVASLRELLLMERQLVRGDAGVQIGVEHDPEVEKVIVEGDGEQDRKWIRTNLNFTTDWVPGFWNAVVPSEVEPSRQYWADVKPSREGATWAASRLDGALDFMADYGPVNATFRFGNGQVREWRELYWDFDPAQAAWKGSRGRWSGDHDALISWGSGTVARPLRGRVDDDEQEDLIFPFLESDVLKVRTLISNGDGTWIKHGDEIGWGPAVLSRRTHAGDVDRDGRTDLIFPFQQGGGLVVRTLLSDGDGTWSGHETNVGWGPDIHEFATHVGLVNDDIGADLIFVYDTSDGLTVRTLFSNPDVTWAGRTEVIGWGRGIHEYGALSADVTGDGRTDVVFPYQDGDNGLRVRTLVSNGDGTWVAHGQDIGWGPAIHRSTHLADVTDDDAADLVFFFHDTNRGLIARTLVSNGDGTWNGDEDVVGWGPDVLARPVLASDLDGDGKTDFTFAFQDWRDVGGLTLRSLLPRTGGHWEGVEERILWGSDVHEHPTMIGRFRSDGPSAIAFLFSPGDGLRIRSLSSAGFPWKPIPTSSEGPSLDLPGIPAKRLVRLELR